MSYDTWKTAEPTHYDERICCARCGEPDDVLCAPCARADILDDTSDDAWPAWLPPVPGYLGAAADLVGADWRQVVDLPVRQQAGFSERVSSNAWFDSGGAIDVRPERILHYLVWVHQHLDVEVAQRRRAR